MKTLILYASTYGSTKECAEKLKEKITGDVTLINAEKETLPPPDGFDRVVIGSPVYMGQANKNIKNYCEQYEDKLIGKKFYFFLCCGLAENFDQVLNASYPEQLIKNAASTACFGGELRLSQMKLTHKLITAMMKKATEKENKPEPKILSENIEQLVCEIQK